MNDDNNDNKVNPYNLKWMYLSMPSGIDIPNMCDIPGLCPRMML